MRVVVILLLGLLLLWAMAGCSRTDVSCPTQGYYIGQVVRHKATGETAVVGEVFCREMWIDNGKVKPYWTRPEIWEAVK